MTVGARALLYDAAVEQYGFITSQDAVDLGIDRNRLYRMSEWSGLTRVAHGVYRFDAMPPSSNDQLMEAVLRVGRDAFLQGESVLALHGLALVNPQKIHIGVPRRVRRSLPSFIQVEQRSLPAGDITAYDAIPSTTVHRALLDCAPYVMATRIYQAADRAFHDGLLTRGQRDDVWAAVGDA